MIFTLEGREETRPATSFGLSFGQLRISNVFNGDFAEQWVEVEIGEKVQGSLLNPFVKTEAETFRQDAKDAELSLGESARTREINLSEQSVSWKLESNEEVCSRTLTSEGGKSREKDIQISRRDLRDE